MQRFFQREEKLNDVTIFNLISKSAMNYRERKKEKSAELTTCFIIFECALGGSFLRVSRSGNT